MGRLSCIIQMGPKGNHKCLYKKTEKPLHTEEEKAMQQK